jgi:hypothetical protein
MKLATSWRRLAVTAFTLATVLYTLGAPVHGG